MENRQSIGLQLDDDTLVISGLSRVFTTEANGDLAFAPGLRLGVQSPRHGRRFDVTLAAGAGECTAFISEDGRRVNDSGDIEQGGLADALLSALVRIQDYLERPKGTCSREPASQTSRR